MSGLFNGLEIGKSALATNQLWMNTIGHNVANANTPGYTRQRVIAVTSNPNDSRYGPIGSGVTALGVRNVRDLFLNDQYRTDSQELGQWTASEKSLSQIESLFLEPSDGSISTLLDSFWNSWSDLSTDAQNDTYRNNLLTQTNLLTGAMNRVYSQLQDMQKAIDSDVKLAVKNINDLADQLASLNLQIAKTEISTDRANDLRDQRDYIIDQLSAMADINTIEQDNGSVTVQIGAMTIVDLDQSYKLSTYSVQQGETTLSQISWAGTKANVELSGGEIQGLQDMRDKTIPKYLARLDEIAQALVTNINLVHQSGYGLDGSTGLNFFDPNNTSAADISLSIDIASSPSRIAAASAPDQEGNNINALTISDLRNANLMKNGTVSISSFYSSVVGQIGSESSKAQTMRENYELLIEQVDNARQSVQGVSLDEEMANLVKYQNAYDAAARVITVFDEALNTVISGMGIVGR